MLTRTLAAVGLTLAMLAPVANAAPLVNQQTGIYGAKAVKAHPGTMNKSHYRSKKHLRTACKSGMRRMNGRCIAVHAKKN